MLAERTAAAKGYKKSTARDYFESICIAVILALFVRTFVVQAFKIPSGSMENNLLIGDHLLVNKFVFAPTLTSLERTLLPIDPVRRGDILVFKGPEEPERDLIKRVIGLPGETIEMTNCVVTINGRVLKEPYLDPAIVTPTSCGPNFPAEVVPKDHVFVMGDNRANSGDSRGQLGFVDYDQIVGRAFVVVWPKDDWEWL